MTERYVPNWEPLYDLVGEEVVGNFMWMFQVELSDRAMLQVYKHIDTRRYIHLSSNGQAFAYEPPSHYRSVPAMHVLAEVFATLPGLAGVTAEQIQASRRAVERLGQHV
jgi:hypothetical protein